MIRPVKRRTSIAVACLVLAGCGGGGPIITSKNVARVMPSASDAPVGTDIDQDTLGPQTIDEFVTDGTVKARLKQLGFRLAYVVAFSTRNFVLDPAQAPVGSASYGTFAIVLRDGDAAASGFDFYAARFRAKAKGFTTVLIEGLGDEVLAFRFSELEDAPLPGLAILWRAGNALFSVVGLGNPDPQVNAIRALATTIDRRAAAV